MNVQPDRVPADRIAPLPLPLSLSLPLSLPLPLSLSLSLPLPLPLSLPLSLALLALACGGGTAISADDTGRQQDFQVVQLDYGTGDTGSDPAGRDAMAPDEGSPDDLGAPDPGSDPGSSPADTGRDPGTASDPGADTPLPSDALDEAGPDNAPGDPGASDEGPFDPGPAVGVPTGPFVLSEVMVMPRHADPVLGRYVELVNESAAAADLAGWSLACGDASFFLSPEGTPAPVDAGKRIVAGATADATLNGYAHVTIAWPESFALPAAGTLELRDPKGQVADVAAWSPDFPLFPGSSLERLLPAGPGNVAASWRRAPGLNTFLDDTGLYAGDRGSPREPNLAVTDLPALAAGPDGHAVHAAAPNDAWRFPVAVKAGDAMLFRMDVDRVSGELDGFLTIFGADGEIVSDNVTFADTFDHDFRIAWMPPVDQTVSVLAQADFFSAFHPANARLHVHRADWLDLGDDLYGMVLKVGDKRTLSPALRFNDDPEADPMTIPAGKLLIESSDEAVAKGSGVDVVATGPGTADITVSYTGGAAPVSAKTTVVVWAKADNERCSSALDVTDEGSFDGSTIDADDDYTPHDCVFANLTGGDLVYSITSPDDQRYVLTVTPLGDWDPILYLYDTCPAPYACLDGTKLMGPGEPETLEFWAQANVTYYVVVDGDLLDEGVFTLTVEKL